MTEKLYYKDAYIKNFSSRVLSCEPTKGGYAIVLAATAFFPEEGGQYADTGVLNGIIVNDVQEKDGVIYHMTDNQRLIELVGSIWQQVYRYRIERLKGMNRESLAQEHQDLVQALCARDEEAAVRLARLHISNQEVSITKQLEEN